MAAELSSAVSNSANWINRNSLATLFQILERPEIDLDAEIQSNGGRDYRAFVTSGGPAVKIADSDIDISDLDGDVISAAEIHIRLADFGDVLSVNGALPTGIAASLDPLTGVLTLSGEASHDAYEAGSGRSSSARPSRSTHRRELTSSYSTASSGVPRRKRSSR